MTDLNTVSLVGRLTHNVEESNKSFSYLPNGTAKAVVSIAVNKSQKSKDGSYVDYVSYFDVVIFGKFAESLQKYLIKGQQIGVTGSLKQDRWEKDGKKSSKIFIEANNIQLLGKKDNQQQGLQPSTTNSPAQQEYDPSSDFPEDIPF